MTKTPIQWCDFSLNPFRFRNLKTGKVGHHCTKISPGCKNCYASKLNGGPYLSGLTFIEENKAKGQFFLDLQALRTLMRRKKPAKVFWCDMTDIFLEDYPDEWIDQCFAAMALTPHLTHQVLTKRAERMSSYFASDPWPRISLEGSKLCGLSWVNVPLSNVWLGVSVENQQYADERIPHLLRTPAAVRFVSYEPALGPVDFRNIQYRDEDLECCWNVVDGIHQILNSTSVDAIVTSELDGIPKLDWIIIGGESGPSARPFNIAWARQTIKQCRVAGTACFVKQLGAHPYSEKTTHCSDPGATHDIANGGYYRVEPLSLKDRKGGDMAEWFEDLRVREMPELIA